MTPLSYRYHHFPPSIIQHAIWLYLRFTLSYRDVEDLLAERRLDVSYETIRRWTIHDLGPGNLKFNGGILFGLTPAAARQTLRWQAEYEIRF